MLRADPAVFPERAGRSMLATLLSAVLDRLTTVADHVGRLALYTGLLLVALTDLRLPANVGGLADVFLALGAICASFVALRGQRLRLAAFKFHALGALLFVLGIAISTTQIRQDTFENFLNLSKFLFTTTLLFFACVVLIRHRRQVRLALICWVLSVVLTSLVAIAQAALGGALFGPDVAVSRMAGLTTNPNHLGAVAGMGMIGALSLAVRVQRVERVLWLLALVVCIAGVIVSASRTGAVVALGSLCVWLVVHFRLRRNATLMIAGISLAAAAVAGILFVAVGGGNNLADRLSAAAEPERDRAVSARLQQYDLVLYESLKSPWVGVGLAEKDAAVYGIIHNMFLRVFYGGGIISLVGMLIIIGDLLFKSYRTFDSTQTYDTKVIALCAFAGVIGMILSGMTEPVLYQRQLWVPAALALALWALQHQRQRRRMMTGKHSFGGRAARTPRIMRTSRSEISREA